MGGSQNSLSCSWRGNGVVYLISRDLWHLIRGTHNVRWRGHWTQYVENFVLINFLTILIRDGGYWEGIRGNWRKDFQCALYPFVVYINKCLLQLKIIVSNRIASIGPIERSRRQFSFENIHDYFVWIRRNIFLSYDSRNDESTYRETIKFPLTYNPKTP